MGWTGIWRGILVFVFSSERHPRGCRVGSGGVGANRGDASGLGDRKEFVLARGTRQLLAQGAADLLGHQRPQCAFIDQVHSVAFGGSRLKFRGVWSRQCCFVWFDCFIWFDRCVCFECWLLSRCLGKVAPMHAAVKLPSSEESQQARSALQVLEKVRKAKKSAKTVQIRPSEGGPDVSVVVPREAFELFLEVLGQMANGSAVTIVPVQAELTTQQAADMLNVSRPHLIELLESGKIPFRRVGTHRRVRASDLIAFQQKDDAERKAVLDELTEEAQKHGLGY